MFLIARAQASRGVPPLELSAWRYPVPKKGQHREMKTQGPGEESGHGLNETFQ